MRWFDAKDSNSPATTPRGGGEITRSQALVIHSVSLDSTRAGGIEQTIREFLTHSIGDYFLVRRANRGERAETHRVGRAAGEIQIHAVNEFEFFVRVSLSRLFGRIRRLASEYSEVHTHQYLWAPFFKILFPRHRLVVFLHNDFFTGLDRETAFRRIARKTIVFALNGIVTVVADRVVSFSGAHLPFAARKVLYSRVGFDAEIFSPPPIASRRTGILWVGRFEPVKDPLLAVRTFRHIADQVREPLFMCGEGSLKTEVQRLVSEWGLESRVHFLGKLLPEELAVEFARSKVLLISSWSETGPKVALEALAMNLRVVSTSAADPWGMIREHGLVAQSRNASELGHLLMDAIRSKESVTEQAVDGLAASVLVPRLEKALGQ